MFVDHTVFYDSWSLKLVDNRNINWVFHRSPIARFCFTAPRGRYRPLWEPLIYILRYQTEA